MLELNLKPYEQFKKMKFENFMGESINTELVKDLWDINDHFNMSAQTPGFRHGDSALFYFAREIKSLKRIFIANFCNIYWIEIINCDTIY